MGNYLYDEENSPKLIHNKELNINEYPKLFDILKNINDNIESIKSFTQNIEYFNKLVFNNSDNKISFNELEMNTGIEIEKKIMQKIMRN